MKIATLQGPLQIGLDSRRFVPAAKMDQASPPILDPKQPHNIGDWFVTKVTDRLLDFDELIIVGPGAGEREWELVNSECDALVLKGGNYIQPNWLTRVFGLELFEKISIPIVLFGVGLQSGLSENVEFEEEEIEILHYIHNSSAYSSLRGSSTAEALERIGITNTLVTGCPTLFWSREPELKVREPSTDSAAFSYRQGLYSSEQGVYEAQFRAIRQVRERFGRTTVMLQGEEVLLQRYLQATKWEAEHTTSYRPVEGMKLATLTRSPIDAEEIAATLHTQLDRFADPELVGWVMDNCFFSYDIGEYLARYRHEGLVIGCRLHSNLLALAQGIPSFFLIYDERTREIADLFDVPRCNLTEFDPGVDPLSYSWSACEKNYAVYFEEMRRFLEANGLAHKLKADPGEPARDAGGGE
jgi:polysaccharide pyruvyl transferase WcaK-like protein